VVRRRPAEPVHQDSGHPGGPRGDHGLPGGRDQHQRDPHLLAAAVSRRGRGFLDGLEQAHANGHQLSRIASVASFFISRVDTEADQRLAAIGTAEAERLRGRLAIANARLAYGHHERVLASDRWRALAALGARPQRPLWASTSTKDPAYPDTRYVVELVAPGVVNTMPEATLLAVEDHGVVPADSIRGRYAEAEAVLRDLDAVGVDYDEVVGTLERNGIAGFEDSWAKLAGRLADRLRAAPAGTRMG
jgi:transaldolase